jgi:hypothetical protein
MNLFKNLLFLHGHFTDPHMDDGYGDGPTEPGHYAEGYGNRAATARSLRQPWQSAQSALAAATGPDEGTCRACNDVG